MFSLLHFALREKKGSSFTRQKNDMTEEIRKKIGGVVAAWAYSRGGGRKSHI